MQSSFKIQIIKKNPLTKSFRNFAVAYLSILSKVMGWWRTVCSSAISMTHCDPNSSSVNRKVFVTIIVLHIQLNTRRKVFRRLPSKPHLEAIKQRHDPNRQCRGEKGASIATLLLGG